MLNSFSSDVDEEKVKLMAEHSAELEIEINASRADDEIRREHERDRRNLWLNVYQNNLSNNTGNVLGKTLADKALKDFDEAFSEKESESLFSVVFVNGYRIPEETKGLQNARELCERLKMFTTERSV